MKQRESQNEDGRPSQSKGRATLIFTPVIVSDRGCNRRARLADDIFTSTRTRTVWCLSSVERQRQRQKPGGCWWHGYWSLWFISQGAHLPVRRKSVSHTWLLLLVFFFLSPPHNHTPTRPPASSYASQKMPTSTTTTSIIITTTTTDTES